MKKITVIMLVLAAIGVQAQEKQRVILADQKTFPAEISIQTVRCTDIGYGAKELKINLAGLDGWTLFDHTNSHVGEFGEPCMTAGRCKQPWHDGFTVDDVIQGNPKTEDVTVLRKVSEVRYLGKSEIHGDVCVRYLKEELNTKIRGIEFYHERSGAQQEFAVEYCLK